MTEKKEEDTDEEEDTEEEKTKKTRVLKLSAMLMIKGSVSFNMLPDGTIYRRSKKVENIFT